VEVFFVLRRPVLLYTGVQGKWCEAVANPFGLESEFGYVKESVFATLEIGKQRHLEEIARLVDKHLKKVHDDELARMTKDATEKYLFLDVPAVVWGWNGVRATADGGRPLHKWWTFRLLWTPAAARG
jgi:hypothetical protein